MGELKECGCKDLAIKKLEEELKNAKDKTFAEPIIGYLVKRCEEDNGLCEDVCQEHKTWNKCYSYLYENARKMADGKSQCTVRSDVVFEWAEDYYHKDDKAEEEKKAKEAEERKKKAELAKTKAVKKPAPSNKDVKVPEKSVQKEPKNEPKAPITGLEGQMSIFDLL